VAVTIRPGRPEDLAAVKGFATDTFEWGDYVPDAYPEWLNEPNTVVLVATDPNDSPVALGRVVLLSTREAWFSAARVRPDHRRQGIGSIINDHGVEWARDQGAQVMRLATEDNNTGARSQVEKLGYRPVARFVMAQRHFGQPEPGTNGGKRLPADEKLDLASSSEAEPAYLVWSSGDYPAASHGLYACEGWAFRRLHAADLVRSARHRQLWASPSAWVVIEPDEDQLWLPFLLTTAEDATRAARSLTDLAVERTVKSMRALIPRIDWLEEALSAEHFQILHPNHIYEKPL
jgi:ribosomal protein S18 acetylase RimI-like enzyme